jgi:hypothetical protein
VGNGNAESVDDAEKWYFSGLSGIQRIQRFRGMEDAMFKEGDSVVVKPGIVDPDFGVEIGGWQGRILEEEQGLDWTKMYLEAQEIELTSPRDTEEDVARAIKGLSKEYAWSYLGEEGKRIGKVLGGVDEDDEMAALDAWEEHLSKSLGFPFEAEVAEYQEIGPLQAGDRVKVMGIALVDDLYGVIVDLRHGRRKYAFPLCDLEVIDEKSANYQIVRD